DRGNHLFFPEDATGIGNLRVARNEISPSMTCVIVAAHEFQNLCLQGRGFRHSNGLGAGVGGTHLMLPKDECCSNLSERTPCLAPRPSRQHIAGHAARSVWISPLTWQGRRRLAGVA